MYLFSILLLAGVIISILLFLYTVYSLLWYAFKIPQKKVKMKANVGRRLFYVIRNVFLQGKLFKDLSGGIMHAIMFWGFIAFAGYSLSFFFTGLLPGKTLIPPGGFADAVFLTVDILAVILIADVIYAVLRRWVIKIPRYQGYNGFEAAFILFLIGTLMITYYILGILRIDGVSQSIPGAIMEGLPVKYTPITYALATSLPKITGPAGYYLYWTTWTIHALDFLVFLVYIPRSKHLHLLAAPFNVLLLKDTPQAQLMPIDFEKETKFGATDIRDFTWKDYLDFYACTECGRCTANCPAAMTGKTLSPRDIIWDLREVVLAEGPEVRRSHGDPAKSDLTKPVIGSAIAEEDLWSCTTCMACVEQCPVMIDHLDKIVNMRRSLVLNEGKAPKETIDMYRNLEMYNSPFNNPQSTRADWAKDLGINIISKSQSDDFDLLYWVGCVSSFDPRNREIAKSVVKILKEAKINFAILGEEEKCTGDPAKRTGNEYLAQTLATQNIETLKKHKVKKIITACPHCFNSLKNDYASMGYSVEVFHHTEYIAKLIEDGKIKVAKEENKEEKYTFHDPCYLGRYNRVFDAPREALGSVSSNVVEMAMNKTKSLCCGAGGGRLWMNETVGTKVSHKRMEMADQTGATTLVTACPYCMIMLDDARKVTNREEKIKINDLSEIIASRLP